MLDQDVVALIVETINYWQAKLSHDNAEVREAAKVHLTRTSADLHWYLTTH